MARRSLVRMASAPAVLVLAAAALAAVTVGCAPVPADVPVTTALTESRAPSAAPSSPETTFRPPSTTEHSGPDQPPSTDRAGDGAPSTGDDATVTQVVDGDTIQVTVGGRQEAVRLIGIDTPEVGEPFSEQAADALRSLVEGRRVRLEPDAEARDIYGRLLAYVWVGETMTNEELLRQGLATLFTVQPNVRHVDRLLAAQDAAQAAGRSIWGGPADAPLEIEDIRYDAAGEDDENLNDEYVVFRILAAGSLLGYAVEDESGKRYDFPDRVYTGGEVFRLRSGAGSDTKTDLYWGMAGSAVWNNGGDTVKVLDARGHIVTSESY